MKQKHKPPNLTRLIPSKYCPIVVLSLFLFLTACSSSAPDGVIARINGQPVTLKQVEAVMDSRFAPNAIFQNNSLASLKNYYSDALASIIVTNLIHEELEKRKIMVDETHIHNELELLLEKDYIKYFDQYKETLPFDQEDWLSMFKSYMETLLFINKILIPEIIIHQDKIQEFYTENIKQFTLPARYEINVVSTKNKELLEKYCKNTGNMLSGDDKNFNIFTYFIEEGENFDDITYNGNVQSGICSPLKFDQEYWDVVVPKLKHSARKMELPEVYNMIEEILKMKEVNIRFNNWLEKKLEHTKIEIIPSLISNFIS